MDRKMYLETSRMVIRNFTPEDALDLYEILGDDETMENCEPPYSFQKTKDFLESFCINRNGALAAIHKESNKVIGYILFNECSSGIYEIGWFFNRNFWRHGFAYESCKALIDYAFEELSAHKIFAETTDTVKSAGLMQKLGMQFESIQSSPADNMHDNGTDLYFYGLLKDDWKARL